MSRIHDALRRAEQPQPQDDHAPAMLPPAAAAAHREEPLAVERAGVSSRAEFIEVEVGADPEDGWAGFRQYLAVLRRRKWLIASAGLIGAMVGAGLALDSLPMYRARTSVEIQTLNPSFMSAVEIDPLASQRGGLDVPTEIVLLQSQTLVRRAAQKLQALDRPNIRMAPTALSQLLNRVGVQTPQQEITWKAAVQIAADRVGAAPVGASRVVEILSVSPDRNAAVEFVNTLANEFIDANLEARWHAAQRGSEWLQRQLSDLRQKLQQAEAEYQAYGLSAGLPANAQTGTVTSEKLRQLRDELLKAQSLKRDREAQYRILSEGPPDALLEVIDDGTLRTLQMKLTELRQQMADLGSALTPAHYRVQRLQAQISEIETAYKTEMARIVKRAQNDFEAAQEQEQSLAAAYAAQEKLVAAEDSKMVKHGLLKREADTIRQLYDALLQKTKEASVAQTMLASNIRIVDPAEPAQTANQPDAWRYSLAGFLTGISLCGALVVVLARLDSSFRSPGQSALVLNVPELGVVPSAKGRMNSPGGRRGLPRAQSLGQLLKPSNGVASVELATWEQKPAAVAESFRAVLTSILFAGERGSRLRVLAVTSAQSLEGKSTVVSNLALAMAETNRRVLLIDADLRRPRLHRIYRLANTSGLSELLRGSAAFDTCPLEMLAQPSNVPGLHVLTAGGKPPDTTEIPPSTTLLSSLRLAELLERFRQEYDLVLIDTPPVLNAVDARLIGRICDGVVLVVRAGKTSRDAALTVRKRLSDDGIRIVGTVLNNWNPDSANEYYHYLGYSPQD
jgi:capsular exopolysaccharide synthesis family protein